MRSRSSRPPAPGRPWQRSAAQRGSVAVAFASAASAWLLLCSPSFSGLPSLLGGRGRGPGATRRAGGEAPADSILSEDDAIALDGFERPEDMEEEEPPAPRKFVGSIKSFAPPKGYGFIECKETYQQWQSDVYVHKNELSWLEKVKPGTVVQFTTELVKGSPQARDVQPFEPQNLVDPTKTFIGKIKKFVPSKGFGFVECDDSHRIFGCDIFLHKIQVEQAGNPQIGDLVSFTVGVSNKGQPQARNVAKFQPDKFAEDQDLTTSSADVPVSSGESVVESD